MRPFAAIAVACAVALLSLGCATPPAHLYNLTGAVAIGQANENALDVSVVVGPVSMPALFNVPQIVVIKGANQVSLDEFNRWASPLADNISRVVADNLVVMLGTNRVAVFQWSPNAEPDYRVAIDFQTFESSLGHAASISAIWTVRRTKDGKTQTDRTVVRIAASGPGYDALMAAHDQALMRLSENISGAIRVLNSTVP